MNDLSEYEKIFSSFKDLISDELTFNQLNKLNWVVTEKIHGANFRFIYQDKKLRFGKRKELLAWSDDFFGFQTVVVRLERQIMELVETVQLDFDVEKIIVYGELFGGIYPHPDVVASSDVYAVQTGIFYSPDIEFCAFDIGIQSEETAIKKYLDYQTALSYFEKFNILHARPLKLGSLSEALNFDIHIESSIPQQLGLPVIKDNFIEGVVIKPLKYSQKPGLGFRPIIKIKNPEFQENKNYHLAQKWSFLRNTESFSQDLDFLMDDLRGYITENRLNNAVSKVGRLNAQDSRRRQMIEKEFLDDILFDFNSDNNNILGELTDDQNQWITERTKAAILHLISVVSSK